MKGGYRDGLKHQKGRNKGLLHSKDAQSYMTPSLYLCVIVHNQSRPADIFLPNWERGRPAALDVSVISTLQQLTLKKVQFNMRQRYRDRVM